MPSATVFADAEAATHDMAFPIVGIGASAGGLEALEQLLAGVPADSGMAFVIIQHLDPKRPGMLPELLQRATTMAVKQAANRMRIKPDCVYVIPPDKDISILHGSLYLLEMTTRHGLHLPIDTFLTSLAEDRREQAIGVILSGMGSDGTAGLAAIRKRGGLALVQTPETAKFDAMPRSAIAAGLADIVAPAGEIPGLIRARKRHHPLLAEVPVAPDSPAGNSAFEKVCILLRAQTGHDFSLYKRSTLYRRIERRIAIHQLAGIADYAIFLQSNPQEIDLLFKELLIGVTQFFRDPAAWAWLQENVLPAMIRANPPGNVLRAWVAGCSSGEEAYSLAIAFQESIDRIKPKERVERSHFRHRPRPRCHCPGPPGALSGKHCRRCVGGAPGPLLQGGWRQVPGQPGDPPDGGIRAAQCHDGPAVYPAGHAHLPEPADLSGSGTAKEAGAAVPLQPEARRHPFSGQCREHRRLWRAFFAVRCQGPHLPPGADLCPGHWM